MKQVGCRKCAEATLSAFVQPNLVGHQAWFNALWPTDLAPHTRGKDLKGKGHLEGTEGLIGKAARHLMRETSGLDTHPSVHCGSLQPAAPLTTVSLLIPCLLPCPSQPNSPSRALRFSSACSAAQPTSIERSSPSSRNLRHASSSTQAQECELTVNGIGSSSLPPTLLPVLLCRATPSL